MMDRSDRRPLPKSRSDARRSEGSIQPALQPLGPPQDRWFADASDEQKHAAVHVLLAIAAGDGRVTQEEKAAIAHACQRMGVSAMQVAEALGRGMPDGIAAPSDRDDRQRLLVDAAAVMVADRHIDDREIAVLLTVGKSLGFSAQEVGDIAAMVTSAIAEQSRRESVIGRLIDGRP